MTKMKKLVAFAAIIGLTTSLFAGAPSSLTKIATNGLIEDGLVDDFDVGVDGAKGLWFGGYNGWFGNFNAGFGTYVGKIWLSVFDDLLYSSITSKKGEYKTIDEQAEDTVNIDDTKTSTTDRDSKEDVYFYNDLYFAFAVNKVGAQLFWQVLDYTPDAENYTTVADGVTSKQSQKYYNAENSVGAYINGVGVKDIGNVNFYAELKEISVRMVMNNALENTSTVVDPEAEKTEDTPTVTGNTKTDEKYAAFTPLIGLEFGLTLPAIGNSVSKLYFTDKFSYEIPTKSESSSSETVDVTNPESTVTTKTTQVYDWNVKGTWNNILTPNLETEYTIGENLVVKTGLSAKVTMKNSYSGLNSPFRKVVETTTVDNVNLKTEKSVTETNDYDSFNNYLTTTFTTALEPKLSFGLRYAVKPNKCYLNLGATWTAGTCTWKYATKSMQQGKKTVKTTVTDEFGQETVTDDDVTIYSADTTLEDTNPAEESVTYTFTSQNPGSDKLWVGTTWYLTDAATVDLLYTAGVDSISLFGTNGIFTSSLAAMFTIKF